MAKKAEAIEKLTEFAETAGNEDDSKAFMDPSPPKRKRGRPRKDELIPEPSAPQIDPQIQIQQQIENNKNLVRPLFGLMSDTGVKYAGTKEAEIDTPTMVVLVDTAAICIHQYLPDVLGRHAALITLSLTFGQWVLRVHMLRQLEIQKLRQNTIEVPKEMSKAA